MIFVISLLVYANGIAFNLFSAPMFANDIIAYVALAVAVTFAAIVLTTIFRDIRHGVSTKTEMPIPVTVHENINEIELSPEALQTIKNLEIEMEESEQKKQQLKQIIEPPTKVICPACREAFYLPNYERDYIVDFGPPKQSNVYRRCPHCKLPIALKQEKCCRRGHLERIMLDY